MGSNISGTLESLSNNITELRGVLEGAEEKLDDARRESESALRDLHGAMSDAERAVGERDQVLEDLGDMRRGLRTPEEVCEKWLDLTLD